MAMLNTRKETRPSAAQNAIGNQSGPYQRMAPEMFRLPSRAINGIICMNGRQRNSTTRWSNRNSVLAVRLILTFPGFSVPTNILMPHHHRFINASVKNTDDG